MPHRVANFFRNPTSSFENQVTAIKKSTIRSRTTSPNRTNSGGLTTSTSSSSERVVSPYASSTEDEQDMDTTAREQSPAPPVRRPMESPRLRPGADRHHSYEKDHHRISFPSLHGLHLGRSSKDTHSNPHASLRWKIESPPIIFHGDVEDSTGALVSGQLFLDVRDETYDIESFKATLHIHVTQKKPTNVHCNECTNQYTLLKEWTFLPGPLALGRGVHPFPFSVLLGGHLPASLDSPVVSIAYEFKAEAVPGRYGQQPIRLEKIFDVKRSLPAPELPHHSIRVFPPTNVKASVHYQQVIHPIGTNNLSMRLDGIAKLNNAANTVEYWKLKKLTWRLEETIKTVAPVCEKHGPRPDAEPTNEEQQRRKGTTRTDTRVIGEKTLFSGWKSTYSSSTDSIVEFELEYHLNKHAKYSCDLKSHDGTEVSHQLMLEMVVSQECAPVGKPGLVTQTGVGRILRMHFGATLTERGGLGISWDSEAPPIYQDVPPSPPAYCEDVGPIEDVLETLDGARPGATGSGTWTPTGRSSGHVTPTRSRRNSVDGHR
ncbi:Endocytosis regulator [Cytospora paraplurivora]|uniref:Endocytosis regulator n=1 Tax=Cytospora paraplurivora TaxID=2898453 RepID=A0AAN9U2X9_9PEZI